jgi:hypothetical protein
MMNFNSPMRCVFQATAISIAQAAGSTEISRAFEVRHASGRCSPEARFTASFHRLRADSSS